MPNILRSPSKIVPSVDGIVACYFGITPESNPLPSGLKGDALILGPP